MDLNTFENEHAAREDETLDWLEAEVHQAIKRGDKRCLDRLTFLMQCVTYSGTLVSSILSIQDFTKNHAFHPAWQVKRLLPKSSELVIDPNKPNRKHRSRK